MISPLTNSIANTIYKAMKGLFLDATITRDTITPSSPDVPFDPPTPTQTDYACKAIVEEYSDFYKLNGLVRDNERKFIILNKSLSITPQPGDRITIRGQTYSISSVVADPALATWTCKGG
jgi:hypothetical protein